MAKHDIELYGRKTFFIAPDTSLIPQSHLEEFLGLGFESFMINPDSEGQLKTKIHEITSSYPEVILYFNIDSHIAGIEWKSYIRELQQSLGREALIGVFHLKRKNFSEDDMITSYFVRDLGVRAGSFALFPDAAKNFDLILKNLEKNNARGRRNLVRATCDSDSTMKFEHNGIPYTVNLVDVNVTHFRCDMRDVADNFSVFEKIHDAVLYVNGSQFVSDAVLIMKRNFGGKNLCVFMFVKKDNTPDLDKETERLLNKKIYEIVLNENMRRISHLS